MMEISYITIETLSPVVLMASGSSRLLTTCSDSFSGTLLRGALAGQYITKHHLGAAAHEDETFIRYFFSGLRFVRANPMVQGKRAAVLPLSLMKAKAADASKPVLDLLSDQAAPGYKSLKGLAFVDNGILTPADVRSSMNFHMSRSTVAERLSGHSQDGKVYTYESIDAGQCFQGAIIGEKECLQAFFNDVGHKGKPFLCRVGRSKNTEYGQCRFTFTAPEALPATTPSGTIALVLDSPLLPAGGLAVQASEVLQQTVIDRLDALTQSTAFQLGKVFSAPETVENFVSIWQMRRPQCTALAAGTVFEIQKNGDWTEGDGQALKQLMYEGAGERTEEGFGQLRIWQSQPLKIEKKDKAFEKSSLPVCSPEVRKRASQILEKVIREKLRNFAYEDADSLEGLDSHAKTHTFARLESWLHGDFHKNFQKMAVNGPLERQLHRMRLNKVSLYDILSGRKSEPYDNKERQEALKNLIPDELAKKVGFIFSKDEYFHAYWLWFFRHGRKQAVQVRSNASEAMNDEK